MCGIVGVASINKQENKIWLNIARDTLIHRGPDAAGVWWSEDDRVGFGHRRLSILDLSTLGNQPMERSDLGITIVFNGEIYNYKELKNQLIKIGYNFYSNSDTEVLIVAYAKWGKDCLNKLNGMFAFALYDSFKQQLFLARDRAGEKPLFYRIESGTIYFSSELKAFLSNPKMPRKINKVSLDCYLAMGYVPGDNCILNEYKKLPPAHALLFSVQSFSVKLWRYWKLPELEKTANKSDETELLNELENLLETAVGRQLRADVPVGIMLSGGVDSSLVAAMAVRHSSNVHTFCIGFPGHGKLDETYHARYISKILGTKHVELMADSPSVDILTLLARQFDEPVVDSSMFPMWLVSRLVSKYCTVALGGDGGDELFAGYKSYSRLLWMKQYIRPVPYTLRHIIAQFAEAALPIGFKGRNYLQSFDFDFCSSLPSQNFLFDYPNRCRLLGYNRNKKYHSDNIFIQRIPLNEDLLQRATRNDFENYLAEDILVKVDRSSMLNSLEVRAPMLDVDLVDFAFAKVPTHLKATVKTKKILLKRLANRIFPADFDKNRKQGFAIPLSTWLKKGPFRDFIWDTLQKSDFIFDKKTIHELLKNQDKGYSNSERIFALALFEIWRKEYSITI